MGNVACIQAVDNVVAVPQKVDRRTDNRKMLGSDPTSSVSKHAQFPLPHFV